MHLSKILIATVLVTVVKAHMELAYPPAFRSKFNPLVLANAAGTVDYSMTSPLNADGSNFPCKGYHTDLGTPAGASGATWAVGATVNMSITGGAFHNGGSCQASLSFDKGASFTVIHSYVGNCPTAAGGSFDFTIPPSTPTGEAIFAWSWLNNVGNREFYMNCAAVTITGSTSKKRDSNMAFGLRPSLFVANLGNGCTTVEGTDVVFPDPGPDITDTSQKHGTTTGTCKALDGVGGGSAPAVSSVTSGSSEVPSQAPSSSSISSSPLTSQAPSGFVTSYTSAGVPSPMASAPSSSPSSSVITSSIAISDIGLCTGQFTCNGSPSGPCCSKYGWCGVTTAHCDLSLGCDSTRGYCGMNSTSPSSSVSSNSDAAITTSAPGSIVTETVMSTQTVTVTDNGAGEVTITPVTSTPSAA